MTSAKILCDSVSPRGSRLISFELTYQRFIHSEFMTHRCFSRNAASSRAIPLKRTLDAALHYPATPVWWGKNQSGMQAEEQLTDESLRAAKNSWSWGRDQAIACAREASDCGLHKQVANRMLEPYLWITVIATSEFRGLMNFFALRAHPAAQPEFQNLAYRMLRATLNSAPTGIPYGGWHLPFGDRMPPGVTEIEIQIAVATARCARVSYLNHNGDLNLVDDLNLYNKLKESGHWSPFEHCAQAQEERLASSQVGNLGPYWLQHRKQFHNECQSRVNLESLYDRRPAWIRELEARG